MSNIKKYKLVVKEYTDEDANLKRPYGPSHKYGKRDGNIKMSLKALIEDLKDNEAIISDSVKLGHKRIDKKGVNWFEILLESSSDKQTLENLTTPTCKELEYIICSKIVEVKQNN